VKDFEFDALAEAANYRGALMREFGPWLQGRVLEVGAGIGQMSAELRRQPGISELVAVEPDERFSAPFRKAAPDVRLVHGTVAALGADAGWDAIVSINVLEHIEDDGSELERYRGLLCEKRGALCLFVPARPEIYAPIDKDFGHFRRYTRGGLKEKLLKAGFTLTRLRYFNLIGYFGWWWTFRVHKKRSFDRGTVRLFDRRIFPLTSAIERVFPWPPLGQSVLAVAKPGLRAQIPNNKSGL
jgi:SAM-dependent methyltransferase